MGAFNDLTNYGTVENNSEKEEGIMNNYNINQVLAGGFSGIFFAFRFSVLCRSSPGCRSVDLIIITCLYRAVCRLEQESFGI